jgi:hypothetical protein
MERKQVNLSLTIDEHEALTRLARARSSKTKVVDLIYEAIEKTYFSSYPLHEITALRAAEAPKKSANPWFYPSPTDAVCITTSDMIGTLFLADAAGAFAALGVFGILAAVVIGILYALFPLIVMWQLGGVKARIDRQRKEELASLASATEELQRQNALTRQLLRAYGHEPEA